MFLKISSWFAIMGVKIENKLMYQCADPMV
jgi:hypothetical protein